MFSGMSAMFITYTLKYLTNIPRPDTMLIIEADSRFPSGHATVAAVVMSLIIYYSHNHCKNKHVQYFLYIIAVSWFILVSYSRLYLQAHYPIDIMIGGIIGALSTIVVMKTFKHFHYYN
jgi:undecaprenyl-diphosphatase